jgi:hypothetical protein
MKITRKKLQRVIREETARLEGKRPRRTKKMVKISEAKLRRIIREEIMGECGEDMMDPHMDQMGMHPEEGGMEQASDPHGALANPAQDPLDGWGGDDMEVGMGRGMGRGMGTGGAGMGLGMEEPMMDDDDMLYGEEY